MVLDVKDVIRVVGRAAWYQLRAADWFPKTSTGFVASPAVLGKRHLCITGLTAKAVKGQANRHMRFVIDVM